MGLMFPNDQKYDSLFIASGKAHGIKPSLLKGFAAAESGFNPDVIVWEPSHRRTRQAGDKYASRGILQITDQMAKAVKWPKDLPIERLADPALGIEYGARAIKRYLDDPLRNYNWAVKVGLRKPGGIVTGMPKVSDAVAAYNMGFPRAITNTTAGIAKLYRYPLTYKTNPPPGWAYANQPYVDKVLAYAALYEADFNGDREAVQRIKAAIKKKDLALLRNAILPLQYPWRLLPWLAVLSGC